MIDKFIPSSQVLKNSAFAAALIGLAAFAPNSHAALLLSGAADPGTMILDTGPVTYANTPTNSFSGTIETFVYKQPTTNFLDFVYKVSSDSSSETLGTSSISGFPSGSVTGKHYLASSGSGDYFPPTVNGSTTMTMIWTDSGGAATLPVGQTSDQIIVQTNLTAWKIANASFLGTDSTVANVGVPVAAVPEPASAVGALIVGAFALGRRRRRA